MKLNPKYSFEFNSILNPNFSEMEQIKNFASILSDKERFLPLVLIIEKNKEVIEKYLGFQLLNELDFFVVRAEKFKSFSEPITIEYSIFPEEMFLFLLKEVLKVSITIRFQSEQSREEYVNKFIFSLLKLNSFKPFNLEKAFSKLEEESLLRYTNYHLSDKDFSENTLKFYLKKEFE